MVFYPDGDVAEVWDVGEGKLKFVKIWRSLSLLKWVPSFGLASQKER